MACVGSASGNCVVPRKGLTVVNTQWYPWDKGKGFLESICQDWPGLVHWTVHPRVPFVTCWWSCQSGTLARLPWPQVLALPCPL